MKKKPLVINLFGGPGVGKSTTTAGLFYFLKLSGYNAEMSREYAKDLVWGKRYGTLKDQNYLFGKQHHRLFNLQDDVDVIVTDCPLILSSVYGEKLSESFHQNVMNTFNEYNNINFLLTREKPYNPKGRTQTLEESNVIHDKILKVLEKNDIEYTTVVGDENAAPEIFNIIKKII